MPAGFIVGTSTAKIRLDTEQAEELLALAQARGELRKLQSITPTSVALTAAIEVRARWQGLQPIPKTNMGQAALVAVHFAQVSCS